MTKTKTDTTFVKITVNDIYNKLNEMEDNRENGDKIRDEQHDVIIQRLDVTNGKVKLNKWIATTALSLTISIVLLALGFMVNFVMKMP